ncbi:hypothetical protein Dimus_007350 [Dionaea muscipula]
MGAKGRLEVLLVDCKEIRNTRFLGKMSPYVIVRYGNQEHRSSVAKGQGRNPEWNETIEFQVDYPGDSVYKYKLVFLIMDKHKCCPDEVNGETKVYLEDAISLGMENKKLEIHPSKYRVVLPNKKYAGEINVGITFTSNDYSDERKLRVSEIVEDEEKENEQERK